MSEQDFGPDDVEATGIFLRLVGQLAPRDVANLLLRTDLQWLAQALAEIRAREWHRGYNQARTDHLNGIDVARNLNPDLPSREELGQIRGEVPDPDSPSGWTSVPRVEDYPGGRWPGKSA